MSIKLIIDSAADISEKEAKELGITMIPMIVSFGEEEYFDGVNLLPDEFYNKLINGKVLPKTAQVTSFRFEEAFSEATKNGDDVIAIVLSSKLSGTYQGAKMASENFGGKVHVIDSLSATVGCRLLVQLALKLIDEGKDVKEIVSIIEEKKKKLVVLGALETLEYLKKGGRISSAVALIGGILNIKPIVQIIDGEVKMAGKARGRKKSAELLNSIIKDFGGIDFSMPLGVLWTGLDESVATTYIEESDIWEGNNPPIYKMGSTIGTHVGPGVFGVACFKR